MVCLPLWGEKHKWNDISTVSLTLPSWERRISTEKNTVLAQVGFSSMGFIKRQFFRLRNGLKTNQWLLFFAVIFFLFFDPTSQLLTDQEAPDDRSYLSHAFTIGLDFDLNYSNELVTLFDGESMLPFRLGDLVIKTGRGVKPYFNRDGNLPSHPIGTGILASPFVALFGVMDRLSHNPVLSDRRLYIGSWSYFGFLFAASLCFLLGLLLYHRTFSSVFGSFSRGQTVLAALSTGVIYYTLVRSTMSHAFEFFACSAVLWASVQLYSAIQIQKRVWMWLGLASFLSVANLWVRPANYNVLLVPFIVLILMQLLRDQKIQPKYYLLMIAAIFLWLIPYMLFNLHFYHSLLPSETEVYSLHAPSSIPTGTLARFLYVLSLLPNILPLVFSSEFGVLYTNPILLLGFAGLMVFLLQHIRRNGIPGRKNEVLAVFVLIFIYFAISAVVVLVWRSPASDYGYRYLFGLVPISMFGFALLSQAIAHRWLRVIGLGLLVFAILNAFLYLDAPDLSPSKQVNVYGKLQAYSAKGYELALLKEMVNPETYVTAFRRSYLGMLTLRAVTKLDEGNVTLRKDLKTAALTYEKTPRRIYFQTFVLALLWLLFGVLMDRSGRTYSTDPLSPENDVPLKAHP